MATTPNDEKINLHAVGTEELTRYQLARSGVLEFTRYTMPDYQVNWHHIVTTRILDAFVRGDIKRLMIFMPPRHGKSELLKRLAAYMLGQNPDEQIISTSYSGELASKHNREIQRIIDNYKYNLLYPDVLLGGMMGISDRKYARTSDFFELVGRKGYYRSSGVRGAITGMGFTTGMIDDPFKDRFDAKSQVIRDGVWDWYTSTFMTRMEKAGKIVLVQTLWHEDGLAGRLLKAAKDDPLQDQWFVLRLPAIKDGPPNRLDPRMDGEALWPEKKDVDELLKIKRSSNRDWNALWQQNPTTDGGNMIKRHWWKHYRERPKKFHKMIMTVDAAFKDTDDSDYVVCQVWGRIGPDKFFIDQVRDKLDIIGTLHAIKSLLDRWTEIRGVHVEDKANGPAIIQMLKSKVSGVRAYEPKGSKESRVWAISDQIEGGNVYLPHVSIAPYIEDFLDEVGKFPNGKNDDQVDAMSMALDILTTNERSSFYKLAQKGK